MSSSIKTGSLGAALQQKIESRTARIGIIGLGYVGLPLALLFSDERFPVTGFDVDNLKVKALNQGESYIYHIPATQIQSAQGRGFRATDQYSHLAEMDAIIICVPTPLNEYREPDLSYIQATADAIAPHLRAGPQKAIDERHVGFARTACGPAGLDDRLRDRGHRAHHDGLPVVGRTAAPARNVKLIRYGLIDHAKLSTAVPDERDGDTKMRYAAREIRGAVDRVDNPHVRAEAASRLLAKE